MVFIILFAIILAFILWVVIDLRLGQKKHQSEIQPYKEAPVRSTDAVFIGHGDELFKHMFQLIETAEDHIHVNFYIFRDDKIGYEMLTRLKKKAREGVTVRLMVDWVGLAITRKEIKRLRSAGVKFAKTQSPSFPYLFYSLNERNHRKITVIDGKAGYVGGYNVGDEYLGKDPSKGPWRDYHLYLTGEAVADLQTQFIRDWRKSSGEDLHEDPRYFPPLPEGKLKARIVATDGAHVKESMMKMLSKAKHSVLIGTPYFVPGVEMRDHLIQLAQKGINVQILIPKYPDHPLVKDAAFPYFEPLLKAGVEIRQFYEGFYHSKAMIIDDTIADIGTANFDMRSFHLNLEINCIIYDGDWVREVKSKIEKDFYGSSEKITMEHVNNRTFGDKAKEALATAISPFM
ncbi:cardiolipin synthase [Evansella clarkii]|uniref:cardiolipin synthase n=1 Tax=Evansella clarkii TaxID=79879 RepID=UPI000997A09E|nr:cardiolipin synthase [Evansella clarkii]